MKILKFKIYRIFQFYNFIYPSSKRKRRGVNLCIFQVTQRISRSNTKTLKNSSNLVRPRTFVPPLVFPYSELVKIFSYRILTFWLQAWLRGRFSPPPPETPRMSERWREREKRLEKIYFETPHLKVFHQRIDGFESTFNNSSKNSLKFWGFSRRTSKIVTFN